MINSEKLVPVVKTLLLSVTMTTVPLIMQQYFTPVIVGITAICGLILTIYKMLNEISTFKERKNKKG